MLIEPGRGEVATSDVILFCSSIIISSNNRGWDYIVVSPGLGMGSGFCLLLNIISEKS